jgi:hypothetical protein
MGGLHSELISAQQLPADPRWELVLRVASSSLFSKGPKLRAFLLYVCENALQGKPENLTAQLIGTRVFGRDADYIPSEDNIVRVEARELRKRLAAYFEGDGRDEPVVIEIPKGSYCPVFAPRQPVPSITLDPRLESSVVQSVLQVPPTPPAQKRWLVPLLAAALGLAIAVIVWQAFSDPMRKNEDTYVQSLHLRSAAPPSFSNYRDLLGPLGDVPGRDALLVLSNPRLMTYFVSQTDQDATTSADLGVKVPKEAKSAFYPLLKPADSAYPYLFFHVSRQDYTGIGEAVAAFHVGRLMDLLGRRVRLTQGRFLNWDHIQKQDLVVLGGPFSNDWTYEKDAKSNFSIVGSSVVNANPLPGEQASYPRDSNTDYALILKLNTPYNFQTVLLAGLSSAGTAAAGEFLANPVKMNAIYQMLKDANHGQGFPSDWEVLLKVAVRDELPLETSVVTIRPKLGPKK